MSSEQMKFHFVKNLESIQETLPPPLEGVDNYEEKLEAWKYLTNPKRQEIYEAYLKKPGTRNDSARAWCERINKERKFPMTFWDPKSPTTIHYLNTQQIEEF